MGSDVLTWEEASLCETKKESAGQESWVVLNQTHESHDQTPEKDDAGEEHTRCEALKHDVGSRLSQTYRMIGLSQLSVQDTLGSEC
jgi:hypothetical protein